MSEAGEKELREAVLDLQWILSKLVQHSCGSTVYPLHPIDIDEAWVRLQRVKDMMADLYE